MEPLRNFVFYTECEKALMGDNFRSPDDLPVASRGNRNVEEYVQPPVVTCICEAENGAMWSIHPGFPFNGMPMNMGHVMDMIPDGDGEGDEEGESEEDNLIPNPKWNRDLSEIALKNIVFNPTKYDLAIKTYLF